MKGMKRRGRGFCFVVLWFFGSWFDDGSKDCIPWFIVPTRYPLKNDWTYFLLASVWIVLSLL